MSKIRLDQALVLRGLTPTRSQAESYIKLGYVKINGKVNSKPGFLVNDDAKFQLTVKEQYVSRAALKLASVADKLHLDFKDKAVLDVGSSTGGFTDYALRRGANRVIAVDVGAD
jgi:23S rRNA (cytidine1920-2'-O)/16S rRNA (cytidine1409-2'-O)-methyltransferase